MPSLISAPKQNFGKLLNRRGGFLAAVYALMVFELAVTASVITYMRHNQDLLAKARKLWWLWLVLVIGLMLVLTLVRLPAVVRFLIFTLVSVILGITALASSEKVSLENIRAAVVSTVAVFAVMTMLAIVLAAAGIDLSFLTFALMVAALALLIGWIVTLFVKPTTAVVRALLITGVVLFSIFVCFDTNMLLMSTNRDVVDGSIGLYLDVFNLFSNFLGLEELDGA